MKTIKLGLGEHRVIKNRGILEINGLGSCICLVIYDKISVVAGMTHIVLPRSTNYSDSNKYKYADTAVIALANDLIRNGAKKKSLQCKISGGANMFLRNKNSDIFKIGRKNSLTVKKAIAACNIRITGEDLGGSAGRSVSFNVSDMILKIKKLGTIEKYI